MLPIAIKTVEKVESGIRRWGSKRVRQTDRQSVIPVWVRAQPAPWYWSFGNYQGEFSWKSPFVLWWHRQRDLGIVGQIVELMRIVGQIMESIRIVKYNRKHRWKKDWTVKEKKIEHRNIKWRKVRLETCIVVKNKFSSLYLLLLRLHHPDSRSFRI